MISRSPLVSVSELERISGWHLRPEGLCRGDVCVPFAVADTNAIDLSVAARALRRPLVSDEAHGLWALGAEAGGRALTSASAPELELPDAEGRAFRLSSLRGQKVLLVAWASW